MSRRFSRRDIVILMAVVLLTTAVLLAGALLVMPGYQPADVLAATAPQVVSVSPADGAKDCPIGQTFSVTFDQDIDPATLSDKTLYINVASGFPLQATVSYDSATKTATLTPKSKLVAGSTYYVTLTVNVRSTAGLSAQGAPRTWSFRTLPAVAPRVVAKSPVDGSVNCPLNQVMTITFDSQMDPAKFTEHSYYFAKRGGAPLPSTIAYDPATLTATLTPSQPLDEASTYDVSLIGTATGVNGMFVYGAPIVWSFTTVLAQPLAVLSKTPSDGAQEQALDVTASVTFDSDINKTTITADSFFVQKVGGERVDTLLTANERSATLTPKNDLEPETTYQVTLTADIKNAKGLSITDAPIVWTFKTKKASSPFSDVSTTNPYFTAIFHLSKQGVIGGFTDGTFRAGAAVMRQQYAKMLVKTLGLTVTGTEVCPFGDVEEQSGTDPFYPSKYVAVCAAHGIIQGKTARLFAPYDDVTRFQAITMVVRGIDDIDRGLLKTPDATYESSWSPALSTVHGENARLAEFNGLLEGLPLAQLDPLGAMTRGEIAQLMWNLMMLLG
ncbi:MAG: Ig-like domain-containing protein [Thermoleophilia bacterium]|nr:Ig-like domain-containing protein [Thermoleophilia bacterium]